MSDQREATGSVGEEATKLLTALQGWAKDSGTDYAHAAAGAASGAASTISEINEHIATGGQDCRYCPICQAIGGVRKASPEVQRHLASAAMSLMQAVTSALAAHTADTEPRRSDAPVEKIDLGDEDWPTS